jgi:Holliday junction resolvase RusA-like endonuclease
VASLESVTICVPREIPSLNRFMRQHWTERLKERNAWRADLYLIGMAHERAWLKSVAAKKRIRVEICSERKRLLDQDNLCVKHVLDALVHAGFIADDSPEHIELVVTQVKSPNRQTIIKISEAA